MRREEHQETGGTSYAHLGNQGKKMSKEEMVTHCEDEDRDLRFHNTEVSGALWLEWMRENEMSKIEVVSISHPFDQDC